MENFTAWSVHACYLSAIVLFVVAASMRYVAATARDFTVVPALPMGKVPVWFYIPSDLSGLGLFTLIFYSLAALGAMSADQGEGNAMTVGGLVFGIGIQFFAPAIAAAIVLGRVNAVQWLGLVWKDWPKVFGIAPLCVLGMFVFSISLYFLGYADLLEAMGVAKEQEAVTLFREGNDPVLLALMAFAAVIVAPLCEEIVFRGYIYPVAKKFSGPRVAALFSALVFAAAHGNVAALVPLFVFGLVLVAVYEKTGSIWAPIGVHFLFNTSTVVIQFLARNADIPDTVMR